MMNILFVTIFIGGVFDLSSCEVMVTLSTGSYIGEQVRTYSDVDYFSFKGIKYASAQRFQRSIPVAKSKNIYNATEFGPACYQDVITMKYYLGETLPISEDCLYLNVYSPNLNGSLPVIVFIHGGAFIVGAPHVYRPDLFMNTGKVVVVSISYRLSAYGFLYFDDPKYPANNGIRDQILALSWVQKNIKYLGGDASRVTLNGQSAGSASIKILMHSPLVKGMFVGAIGESGVDSGRWSLQPRCSGLQKRDMLAKKIGCAQDIPLPGHSADNLVQCLRKKGPDEIIAATLQFGPQYRPPVFTPIVEKTSVGEPVITYFPWLNNTNSSDLVPWITGVNSNEGRTLVPDKLVQNFNNPLIKIGMNIFAPFILPDLFLYKYLAKSSFYVTEAIKDHYRDLLSTDLKKFAIQIVTDSYMNYPLVRSIKSVRSPTYVYFFNFLQPNQMDVGHSGELLYIWPTSTQILRIQQDNDDERLAKTMANAWIHFVYHQTPRIPDIAWERYDYRNDRVLLIENTGIKMADNPSRKQNDFWNKLQVDSSPKVKLC